MIRTRFRKRRQVQDDLRLFIDQARAGSVSGLHLGCGRHRIEGLTNCDLFDDSADRKVGLTDLGEFATGSVDYIEANHVIEHLSFSEVEVALDEWQRVLAPGALCVISCPDFQRLVLRWILRPKYRWSDTIRMVYGSQEHEGMFHKSGYTRERLEGMLQARGFDIVLSYTPYPPRPTPSLLVIGRRRP